MAKKTELEQNLNDEPDQREIDRKCAEMLKSTAKPTKDEKKS